MLSRNMINNIDINDKLILSYMYVLNVIFNNIKIENRIFKHN